MVGGFNIIFNLTLLALHSSKSERSNQPYFCTWTLQDPKWWFCFKFRCIHLESAVLRYLHPGFDNVNWRIAKNGSRSSDRTESTNNELWHRLLRIASAVPILHSFHDKESDGLIGSLFHDCGRQSLICSSDSFVTKTKLQSFSKLRVLLSNHRYLHFLW